MPVCKRKDLNGHALFPFFAQRLWIFSVVGDNNELTCGIDNDFFLQQATATTLDQCKISIHLVSSIDGNVQFWRNLKVRQK